MCLIKKLDKFHGFIMLTLLCNLYAGCISISNSYIHAFGIKYIRNTEVLYYKVSYLFYLIPALRISPGAKCFEQMVACLLTSDRPTKSIQTCFRRGSSGNLWKDVGLGSVKSLIFNLLLLPHPGTAQNGIFYLFKTSFPKSDVNKTFWNCFCCCCCYPAPKWCQLSKLRSQRYTLWLLLSHRDV